MLRPVDQQDMRFLRDMLRHAYHWRLGDPDLPVYRYVHETQLAPRYGWLLGINRSF